LTSLGVFAKKAKSTEKLAESVMKELDAIEL
jgi:hypothetical protein